jgi:hypothetical protein
LLPTIIDVLSKNGIKYHKLIVGKPYADYYIDDKAINAYKDLQKETGTYNVLENEPRAHHTINVQSDTIIKNGELQNEAYYYTNLPSELLKQYFPTIHSITDTSICMDRIKHNTYTQLLLHGKLSAEHIVTLLEQLKALHEYTKVQVTDWAYKEKVKKRFVDNKQLYEDLGITIHDIDNLTNYFFTIEGSIIQGDCVFTNVFENQQFIDPRGNWHNTQSIYGDKHYDYAKVLQSLLGYDYALNNVEIQNIYLQNLIDVFEDWYAANYPLHLMDELYRKTKLLIISMLPFHKEDIERCKRFVNIIK